MKTWIIPLSLLCAAGLARAQATPADTPPPAAAQSAPAPMPAKARMHQRKMARLPRGDLRHCLDQATSTAIIRCSEKPGRR